MQYTSQTGRRKARVGGGQGSGSPWSGSPWTPPKRGQTVKKLTVKKLIDNEMFFFHRLCHLQTVDNEMFFFSPFMSLTNREKSAPNREKIGTKNPNDR